MVRALDYNGTLERREFEPRLRIFGFFFQKVHCFLLVFIIAILLILLS